MLQGAGAFVGKTGGLFFNLGTAMILKMLNSPDFVVPPPPIRTVAFCGISWHFASGKLFMHQEAADESMLMAMVATDCIHWNVHKWRTTGDFPSHKLGLFGVAQFVKAGWIRLV